MIIYIDTFFCLDYADQVAILALENCNGGEKTLRQRTPVLAKKPPPVCSNFKKPTKEEAVSNFKSRFNTKIWKRTQFQKKTVNMTMITKHLCKLQDS